MPRQAVGKRVARAARTGGGRAAARRNTPLSWWTSMGVIVVLGLVLVGWSRHEKFAALHSAENGTPPTLYDHWHAAYAFDICGTIEPNLPQNPNVASAGLHTHGDGNIHIEPQGPADTGKSATLERFIRLYPGLELSPTTVQYPGLQLYHNGQFCGPSEKNKPGYVQIKVWNSPKATTAHIVRDPSKVKIANGMLITIAFVPKGASIPKPPADNINNLLQNMSAAAKGNQSMNLPSTVTTVANNTSTPATTATTAPGATGSKGSTSPAATTPPISGKSSSGNGP